MSEDNHVKILSELEDELEALDFVEWDRWTGGEWAEGHGYVTVYGWIEREGDDYKDFVEVMRWDDGSLYFTTSSAKYTKDIHNVLFDEPAEAHNDCRRVEKVVDIENVVKL